MTKELLIKLATSLEQGPLAGKAPKTVAACTMHLYCRHTSVGLTVARTIANSLQVGESTVRTNLRGIYVGGGGGGVAAGPQVLLSDDAQDILDMCPQASDFELNLPGTAGGMLGEGGGQVARAVPAVGVETSSSAHGSGDGRDVSGGGREWKTPVVGARGGHGMYSNPPPLVNTPHMAGGSMGMSAYASQGYSSQASSSQASHSSHALHAHAPEHASPGSAFHIGVVPAGGGNSYGNGLAERAGLQDARMMSDAFGKNMGHESGAYGKSMGHEADSRQESDYRQESEYHFNYHQR